MKSVLVFSYKAEKECQKEKKAEKNSIFLKTYGKNFLGRIFYLDISQMFSWTS